MAAAGGRAPHRRGRRGFRLRLQGAAQSARRSRGDGARAECRRHPRCRRAAADPSDARDRDARLALRRRAARDDQLCRARDPAARPGTVDQDREHAAGRGLGRPAEAQTGAARATGGRIPGRGHGAAADAGQDIDPAHRQHQARRRLHRRDDGGEATRLGIAGHGRQQRAGAGEQLDRRKIAAGRMAETDRLERRCRGPVGRDRSHGIWPIDAAQAARDDRRHRENLFRRGLHRHPRAAAEGVAGGRETGDDHRPMGALHHRASRNPAEGGGSGARTPPGSTPQRSAARRRSISACS